MKIIMCSMCAIFLMGCAHTAIVLNSNPPKAQVSVGNGQQYVALGATPLRLSAKQLAAKAGNGPYFFKFESDKYIPKEVILATVPSHADVSVNISLDKKPAPFEEQKAELNSMIDQLFESQRLAKVKRYSEALTTLKQLQGQYPSLSAAYELQGGIYFLQRNYRDAYDSYMKAYRLDPKDLETYNMTEYLKEYADRGLKKEQSTPVNQ